MKKVSLFIIGLTMLLVSCKKDPETISFSGKLFDTYLAVPVAGATITLQANGIVDGVYNASFVTIGTTQTAADGSFSFSFEESSYDAYRVTLQKNGYYLQQEIISSSGISPDAPFQQNFSIASLAWLKIHAQNTDPIDNDDVFSCTVQNNPVSCSECCHSTLVSLGGMTVDSTWTCQTVGGFSLSLIYSVTKNNSTVTTPVSLTTIAGDTLEYEILY